MTGGESTSAPVSQPRVRATYEEYDLDDTRVSMIADPENEHAWVQSDLTVDVQR
ncbi:DUF7331 family protein [Halostella salina]|uniref:DUF7331 family protein n=1 Tax=Halostella salina TaxID=1547897 RepID=UPI0013CEDB69|nr:hypothetical protein [Halostella salina]